MIAFLHALAIAALGILGMLLISFILVSLSVTTLTLWIMWKEDRFRFPEGKPDQRAP